MNIILVHLGYTLARVQSAVGHDLVVKIQRAESRHWLAAADGLP